MQWWIGQVTDPDKGEWGDCLEKKQAEDGIRDPLWSRGLGDVYKRQHWISPYKVSCWLIHLISRHRLNTQVHLGVDRRIIQVH